MDDVKGAYEGAKQGAIAHNEAIKATTLSAKVGKIALQGLAMAGNMIAMWTISKGIELLVTSIDNWVHSAERATESLEETTSALADTSNEIENLETQVSDLGNKIAELQALSDAGTISIADEKQLELLKEENKELLTNIALLEDKQRKEAENAVKAIGDSKNDYTYQYLDDTPTTTYADSGIPITNTASHWEFVKTSATEALEKYIQTYQDWKDTAQAENNQGYMDEALEGVNATIEAYKELEKTEAGLDATQQAEYDNALRVQQLYLEHIYAINGTESAYRALNQETQKKILNDRLIAQLGEDNQDYVNAILSAIDPEQYADLWDKDFSFTPPQMTDYVTAEEYGKTYAEAWLDGIVQGSTLDNEAGVSFSDVFNTDGISTVSEEIDKIQNAYKTLSSAIDEYNENGSFSIDTLQSVIALGDDWLDYLVDENGNLKLDNESLQQLTASRLNDMRVQTLNNLIDNVSKIQTDADANLYLASTNYELANSYEAVAQASLQSAKTQLDAAVDAGTLSAYNRDKAWSKINADANKINKLFNNTSLGSISLGGGSSSSSSKSEFSELVDFFERRVKVLSNALELLDTNLENVSGSFAKNKLVDGQLAINEEKIKNYSDALKMYTEGAEYALSKLPSDIAEKVKNGAVDVTYFVGEENEVIAETIDEYEKCAEKVSTYQDELAKLKETLRQLELKKFNNIIEDFTN